MINLWINSETNALIPNWNAFGTATLPPIKQGDKVALDIHWVKSDPSGQFMEEVIMNPSSTIRVAVGLINGGPSSGYFVYSYEGDTIEIPYDADVDSFPIVPPPQNYVYVEKNANTLINSLPSIISAGGVDVTIVNERTFRIVFKQFGARALSSCDSTTLSPSTNVSVIRISAGSSTVKEVHHLRPKLLPVAYSDSFVNSPQPVISIINIDSITSRISISPAPKFGTFTVSNGAGTTSALSVNATAGDIISGLISAGISSSTRTYSVAKSGSYSWDIYRTSGTAETLTVSTNGLVGFSSKNGVIDFNTLEIEDLVAGLPSVNAVLEVEYSYGSLRQTLYQGRVTIVNDLIDAATYNPIPFPELSGGLEEAPQDGVTYGRKDGLWSAINVSGGNIPDYDNTVIYTVGSQVYYNGGLYRMIFSAGVADVEPSTNPTYWESLSGGDLSNYVSKTGANDMALGSSISFANSFKTISISHGDFGIFSTNDINFSLLGELGLQVTGANGTTQVFADGITFPDSTIQTTAATPFDPTGYATESWVTSQGYITSSALAPYATLASPAFSGVPTAPTPLASDSSTTIATTAFVASAVASSTTSASTSKVVQTCRNATGSLIPARSVVYIGGANGNHPTIQLAQANSEYSSYRTFGITSQDIANSADGTVVIIGEVLNVNTGSFAAGDQLFLSPTIAGGITNVKPSAPNHMVYVGVCTRANANNGSIEVKVINGFEINELHDVAINGKLDKDLLSYEQSTNLWKNKSALSLGIAERSWVENTFSPQGHNHSIFNLNGWGSGSNPQSITSGSVLRVYNPNDSTAFVVAREVERRKLIKTSVQPPTRIVEVIYNTTTNSIDGLVYWQIRQVVAFSFTSNILRLNTGSINVASDSASVDTHNWSLGNGYSSPASDRLTGGYGEAFGDTINVLLARNPSGSGTSGRASGAYTGDGVTVSWQSFVSPVLDEGQMPPFNSFESNGGFYEPPSTVVSIEFLDSEPVLNSYIEPVMKGGVLGEMTQELIGLNSFSYAYDNNISKYSLVYDQSLNTWSLDSTVNRLTNIENDIARLSLSNTFSGNSNTFLGMVGLRTTDRGAINFQPNVTPASPQNGDVWMGINTLSIRGSDGQNRQVALTQVAQTFSQPQVIAPVSTATTPALRITNISTTATAHSLVVEDSANPDITSFIVNNAGVVGIQVTPSTWTPATGVVLDVNGRAVFNPINTNTPSLNLGATACNSVPTSVRAGDVWITNVAAPKLAFNTGGVNYYCVVANQFNTFSGGVAVTGASATNPQLAVTQTGTGTAVQITTTGSGNALVVEDSVSPDINSFIIDAGGNVGIGVASGYTPVGKLDVSGTITATTPSNGSDSTLVATTAFVKSAIVPSVTNYGDNQWLPTYVTAWNSIFRLDFTYDQSVQLPTNTQSAAIVGTQIVFLQLGSGRLNFNSTNGNTVMSSGGKYISNQQYSVVTAIKTGTNEWLIAGDLSAS